MSQVFFYERREYGGDDETPVECGDCDWKGAACDLEGISDYEQRVAPGEITPAGECPMCGALAYLLERTPITNDTIVILNDGEWEGRFADFCASNKFEDDEVATIEAELNRRGHFEDGGGALAEFALRVKQ